MKPPEPRRPPSSRPASQRWVKRPPRPSRPSTVVVQPRRRKPGWEPLLMALGMGLAAGITAAVITPMVTQREGWAGLLAGVAFTGSFAVMWRAMGYTLQDLREFFK